MRPIENGGVVLETEQEVLNARFCAAMALGFLPFLEANNPDGDNVLYEAFDYLLESGLKEDIFPRFLDRDQAEILVAAAEIGKQCVDFSYGVIMGLRIMNFHGSQEELGRFMNQQIASDPESVPSHLLDISNSSLRRTQQITQFNRLVMSTLPHLVTIDEV